MIKTNIYIIEKDENIVGASSTPIEIDNMKSQEFEVEDFDFEKMHGYEIINNSLFFNERKWIDYKKNVVELNELRDRRETECFSVINRGDMWYRINVDTPEKENELKQWYKDWLNVTETREVPVKPDWIK